jgi:tetratricopeptide (TPR) repeat protein
MRFPWGKSREDEKAAALNSIWSNLGVKNEKEFFDLASAVDIHCCWCSKLSGIRCDEQGITAFTTKPGLGTAFVATCCNCLERMVIYCRAGAIVAVEQLRSLSDLPGALERAENQIASRGSSLLLARRTTTAPRETTLSWHDKGDKDLKVGLYASAIRCFDQALAINPKSARVWREKGVALSLSGNRAAAIECYTRSLELNIFDDIAWFNKGTSLQRLGHPQEAVACFDKALEIKPSDADIWCNKGLALQSLGRTEEELHCYEEALKRNSEHVEAWLNRGCTLSESGNPREALECFDRVLALNPMDVDAAFNKAAALLHLRESTKALAALRRFTEIAERGDPRLPKAKELIEALSP